MVLKFDGKSEVLRFAKREPVAVYQVMTKPLEKRVGFFLIQASSFV